MAPELSRHTLSSGLDISRVVTGLWQIADMERTGGPVDIDRAAEAMVPYAEAGLTTFDMADHYGSAERIAGHYRSHHQADQPIECLTKWVPHPGPITRSQAREAVDRAASRLQTERIDLLQFHAWSYDDPSWIDGLTWLSELVEEGRIHGLGVTNMDAAHLELALHSGFPIVTNQVSYSLIDTRAAGELTRVCARHGVSLLAYGTLAGGFLTELALGTPEPSVDEVPTWSQMKYKRFIDAAGGWDRFQEVLAVAVESARELGVSTANVVTRAVLDRESVGAVIIGARLGARSHLEDNLRMLELSLGDSGAAPLWDAAARLDPVPGEPGDEYRRPPFLTASGDLSHHVESFPPPYPTRTLDDGRTVALSGTVWEELAGFGRAVRKGDRIWVSGTTSTHGDRVMGGDDPASQTHFVIDKIEGALRSLGARLDDVVRTRIYLSDPNDWEPVSRAHGARFGRVRPANTLVGATVIGPEYRIEMEAEAMVDRSRSG